jgi:hypothetical protein
MVIPDLPHNINRFRFGTGHRFCDKNDITMISVAKVAGPPHRLQSKFDDSVSGNAGSPQVGRTAPSKLK